MKTWYVFVEHTACRHSHRARAQQRTRKKHTHTHRATHTHALRLTYTHTHTHDSRTQNALATQRRTTTDRRELGHGPHRRELGSLGNAVAVAAAAATTTTAAAVATVAAASSSSSSERPSSLLVLTPPRSRGSETGLSVDGSTRTRGGATCDAAARLLWII